MNGRAWAYGLAALLLLPWPVHAQQSAEAAPDVREPGLTNADTPTSTDGHTAEEAADDPGGPPASGAPPVTTDDDDDAPAAETPEPPAPDGAAPPSIRYVLERVEVRGNPRTDHGLIRSYVPVRDGDVLDVDDPRVEVVRWRLLGTGWFDDVRLSLERGSQRGQVVLVVEVRERNTFVVQGITLGFSEGLQRSADPDTRIEPYFGISLAELNLFGTGIGMEATALLSIPQQGVRLRAGVASLRGSDWGLSGSLFFNNGREFFGNDDVVIAVDECPVELERCEEGRNAVVQYRRYGGSLGTGYDLAPTWRFSLEYQLEAVEVVDRPAAASHRRGTELIPIDFAIHDGLSWISALQVGLTHDERDDPGLPTQGRLLYVRADLSSTLIGSSYDFVRVQAGWREYFRLPEARHTLRLGVFLGGAVGDVPFFYKFYAADLSDLIPARVLELNLDRRAPRNLLDTSVREMRAEELAARVDVEYALWIHQGRDALRGVQLYGLVGLYMLMDRDDLRLAISGYSGFARVPLDLTFDLGVRFDTSVGVFQLGLSTLLGFVSL